MTEVLYMYVITLRDGKPKKNRKVPEDTNTHSEYVILIAFPLQQWLHERASLLRYMYIVCLVLLVFFLHGFWRGATLSSVLVVLMSKGNVHQIPTERNYRL